MDAANHALARYLASRDEVHLVTHRAWPDLAAFPNVTVHRVWRPLDRHLLGSPLLSRAGQRVWRRLRSSSAQAIVNGGNCRIAGVNWVHYLHAAIHCSADGSFSRRAKVALTHRRDLTAERAALRAARVVICNSRRTRDDVIERIGVDPSRVRVIYYGGDPVRFSLVNGEERAAAKAALSQPAGRPLVGFVGALGDRRKAFDTVFSAWGELCRCREWDADLIVVGQGAELPAWRRRASEAGLERSDSVRRFSNRRAADSGGPRRAGPSGPLRGVRLVRARSVVPGRAGDRQRLRRRRGTLPARARRAAHRRSERSGGARREAAVVAARNGARPIGGRPLSAALRSRTWDAMAEQIAACAREQA